MKTSNRIALLIGTAIASCVSANAYAQQVADDAAAASQEPTGSANPTAQVPPTEDPVTELDAPASGATPSAGGVAAEEQAGGDGLIVVTGSRIVRNGFDAPTPVSVITEQEIRQAAPTTVADFVNQLPAVAGSQTSRTSGSTIGGGVAGANLINLRNLGPNRTLILLNGRRVPPSTVTGAVDVNTIPQGLISRVDVVTGGASAAWGSDAVSGVVNFILDTKFTGFKGQVQAGITTVGDGASYQADLSWGTRFAGGRGHVVLSANYSDSKEALLRNRSWYGAYKFLLNPTPGNGQPTRLILPNSTVNATREGLITSGPLRGTAFDVNGNVLTTNFQFGTIESGNLQSGGTQNYDMTLDVQQVATPIRQGAVYGRLSYDLTDAINAFVEGSYGDSHTENNSGYFWRVNNEAIRIENPFLPASVRQRMIAAGITSFNLSSINPALGFPIGVNDRRLIRGLAGISGTINGGWRWAASYQYGRTEIDNAARNNLLPARILNAIDSVVGPNGDIVCRSTLTAPTNGCVPYNPFGVRPLTEAQRAYLVTRSEANIRITQHVAEANIQGDLFQLPAGAVTLAAGAEYRKDSGGVVQSDPFGSTVQLYVANQKPFRGSIEVKEGFGEILVPVLKDSALGKSLELNGAVRYTDYSTSGSVVTWKVGATYSPISDLELRVTKSRDIRAPYLNDLFLAGTTLVQFVTDPTRNNAAATVLQTTSGNLNLNPEKADSFTAGVIFRPSFLPGFSASVDYYDIKIKGAIAINSSQQIINFCAAGLTDFCGAVTRDASGALTAVSQIPFNANAELARGIDIETSYRFDAGSGQIDVRGLANYVDKLEIRSVTGVTSRAGEAGNNLGVSQGVPNWRGLATVTWTDDPVTLQIKGRYIGSAKIENDFGPADINRNQVPSIFYLDAFIGHDVRMWNGEGQFYIAVDNVFDKDPPVVVSQDTQIAQALGTNPQNYDTIGRTFRVGYRFKF